MPSVAAENQGQLVEHNGSQLVKLITTSGAVIGTCQAYAVSACNTLPAAKLLVDTVVHMAVRSCIVNGTLLAQGSSSASFTLLLSANSTATGLITSGYAPIIAGTAVGASVVAAGLTAYGLAYGATKAYNHLSSDAKPEQQSRENILVVSEPGEDPVTFISSANATNQRYIDLSALEVIINQYQPSQTFTRRFFSYDSKEIDVLKKVVAKIRNERGNNHPDFECKVSLAYLAEEIEKNSGLLSSVQKYRIDALRNSNYSQLTAKTGTDQVIQAILTEVGRNNSQPRITDRT